MNILDKVLGRDDTNSLTMDRPQPVSRLDTGVQGLIGAALSRVDGPLKVSGKATYAAEYDIKGLAHGVLVRATIGAGKLVTVHGEAAEASPGVIAVVTDTKTFIRNPGQGGENTAPKGGVDDITYFGEPIALVVAETFEAARDGAALVRADYEEGDGSFVFAAHRDEAETPPPSVTPAHYTQGDVDGALAEAAFAIDATYTTPSQNSAAMEPHASIAQWEDDGTLVVHGAYQMIASDQQQLAGALGISADKVRIIARYVGGGFGSKLGIAPECVAAAVAAKQLGRPVKVVMARQQVFDCTVRRSNTQQRVRLGADADGRLTAISHETLASNLPGEDYFEPAGIGTHFVYAGANRRITHDLVRLNWMLAGSMRAPGEAVGQLAVEGAMDELAEKIGIDPIELRQRNDPAQDPEKDIPWSSRQLVRCMDEGAKLFGWNDRKATPGSDRRGEWLHGIGMASAIRSNMLQKSAAKITLTRDGRAIVETDMTDIGTGTYTILAQIAGEVLGLPLDRIDVALGDGQLPPSAGSGGSWGAGSAGSSVYLAADGIRAKIAGKMGVADDAMTLKDGYAIADNRRVALTDLLDESIAVTGQIAPGKQEKETNQASYGAHFAHVKVNAVTGEVRVERFLGVFSAGRILNEKTARSQCYGGMVLGIGSALTEELVHDERNGKIVNRDLGEYHVPVNADVPQIEVHFLDERDIHANPIQAKGIGELGISGAGAAIASAIHNATGVRVRDFPITLDKLLPGLPD